MKKLLTPKLGRLAILLSVTFLLLTIMSSFAQAAAPRQISVVVDGTALTLDVAPQIINSRVMLPYRVVAERLGAQVSWNSQERSVTATKDNTILRMVVGQTSATNSGHAVTLGTQHLCRWPGTSWCLCAF